MLTFVRLTLDKAQILWGERQYLVGSLEKFADDSEHLFTPTCLLTSYSVKDLKEIIIQLESLNLE